MAGINWDELADKVADDLELELGEDIKLKGAELKAFLKQQKADLAARQADIAVRDQELGALRKYQADTTALFGQAARLASAPDPERQQQQRATGAAGNLAPADRFEEEYGNDPLFGPFAKRYGERVMRDVKENLFKPFIEQELAPELRKRDETNRVLTGLLLNERQLREFKEAGEWPEGTDFETARKLGTEKRYYVPGAEQLGVLDFRRLNQDLMAPILQERLIKKAREEGAEEAATRLRQTTNIIQMPNRSGGGGPKGPTREAVGSSAIDKAIGEAAQDRETVKLLSALSR